MACEKARGTFSFKTLSQLEFTKSRAVANSLGNKQGVIANPGETRRLEI